MIKFQVGIIPEGPTPAMFQAWIQAEKDHATFDGCYKAMMAAAPKFVIAEEKK